MNDHELIELNKFKKIVSKVAEYDFPFSTTSSLD